MKNSWSILSFIAVFSLAWVDVAHAETGNTPTLEIRNKSAKIFVKIRDGGKFVASDQSCNEVGPDKTKGFNVDLKSDTELFIYKVSPCGNTSLEPFKVYKFAKDKTIYVTYDNEVVYPQTGPLKGLSGKTVTGLSLSNNVTASKKKESDIVDFTEIFKIQNRSAEQMDYASSRPRTRVASLNKLWEAKCSPQATEGPSQPNSLFCAAGWGNPFAMLMLRIRFTLPKDANNVFQPENHFLKLIGNSLPTPASSAEGAINPKELYLGFFEKIDEEEVIKWSDFDAFIHPVKLNVALTKFINYIMATYGLSIDSSAIPSNIRAADAQRIEIEAKKALPGVSFPSSSVLVNNKRMDLDELYANMCLSGRKWSGTLFCSIGEGDSSADYFGQISFTKPKTIDSHALKQLLSAISAYAEADTGGSSWNSAKQWLTGAVGLPAVRTQLKTAIQKIDDGADKLTWEDLRYSLVIGKWIASKDVTEWIPYYANSSLKAYGLEIAE